MANRLNAGDKVHLQGYRCKRIDGKLKFAKSKIMIGEVKVEDSWAMCGIDHDGDDLQWFLQVRKEWPSKVCKRCEKKFKAMIQAA